MCATDLESVVIIEQRAYEFPWSRAIITGCTTVPYRIWIGEIGADKAHVCQAFLSIVAEEAHILNLSVDPAYQGRGIGNLLLRRLIADAGSQEAAQIFLEVRESNQAAIQMYLNNDFNEIGRRHNYYPISHGREDALILALQLRFD